MWRGFCGWSANNGPLFRGSRSVRVKPASEDPPPPVGVPWDVSRRPRPVIKKHDSGASPNRRGRVPLVNRPALVPVPVLRRAGETRSQRSARRGRLRGGLVLLHSAVAKRPPATGDNDPAVPEGSLGSQGEVTHGHARADRGDLLNAALLGLKGRTGKWTGRMGNQFVFPCRFQVTRVKWFLTEDRLHGTVC